MSCLSASAPASEDMCLRYVEMIHKQRLTSSSTPEWTERVSSNRSSQVLMTRGADEASSRFTPVTLLSAMHPWERSSSSCVPESA